MLFSTNSWPVSWSNLWLVIFYPVSIEFVIAGVFVSVSVLIWDLDLWLVIFSLTSFEFVFVSAQLLVVCISYDMATSPVRIPNLWTLYPSLRITKLLQFKKRFYSS